MTHIDARHLRIIPGNGAGGHAQVEPAPAGGTRGRGFDYAALLGRRRALHRLAGDANANAHADTQTADEEGAEDDADAGLPQAPRLFARAPSAESDSTSGGASANTPARASDEVQDTAEQQALRARVAGAAVPVVSAVYQQQQRCIQVLGTLAREIGAFCSERPIADAGNWEVQLPLHPKLLPQTTLYVSLSRFRLQLRFDAPDTATRQLLLDHSTLLERELDTMLRAWGEAREIELTVW
jgi:type III secretion control protein HpaP